MNALVFPDVHRAEVVQVEAPDPSADEVLVRVDACGVCGSDIALYLGTHPLRMRPVRPGHEIVGRLPSGQRVAVNPLRSCGHCSACLMGEPMHCANIRVVGFGLPGGLAEMVAVRRDQVVALTDAVTLERAALVEPLAVALRACDRLEIESGVRLVVVSAGVVGLLMALESVRRGASVTVVDWREERLSFAAKLGLTSATYRDDSQVEAFRRLLDDDGRLYVASGSAEAMEWSFSVAPRGGRVGLAGTVARTTATRMWKLQDRGLQVMAINMYTPDHLLRAAALLADSRVRFEAVISRRVTLDALPSTLASITQDSWVGKTLVVL